MNNPFAEMSKYQVTKLYELLEVHIYKYNKDEEVLPTIRKENILGIILSGYAQIIDVDYNGNENIVEELVKNSVFGSMISSTNSDSYEIIAKDQVQVLVIDYEKLLHYKNLKFSYFNVFMMNLFDIINTKIDEKNVRLKVLEKKQIRERILEYFDIQYKKRYTKNIYLPISFKDLADYMAVNRSAMFRELKYMKEEKLIEVKGNRVTLLYK